MTASWFGQQPQASALAFDWRTPHYTRRASCRVLDPAEADRLFFRQDGHVTAEAREMCAGCPVRVECLADGVGRDGAWGGMSVPERQRASGAAAA